MSDHGQGRALGQHRMCFKQTPGSLLQLINSLPSKNKSNDSKTASIVKFVLTWGPHNFARTSIQHLDAPGELVDARFLSPPLSEEISTDREGTRQTLATFLTNEKSHVFSERIQRIALLVR